MVSMALVVFFNENKKHSNKKQNKPAKQKNKNSYKLLTKKQKLYKLICMIITKPKA